MRKAQIIRTGNSLVVTLLIISLVWIFMDDRQDGPVAFQHQDPVELPRYKNAFSSLSELIPSKMPSMRH